MDTCNLYSEEDLFKKLSAYQKDKIVLWVGAGVGMMPPSVLPNAKNLMNTIIQEICGKQIIINLYKTWNKVNEALKTENIYLGGSPRLETVISEIKEIERGSTNGFNVLNGFKSFCEIPYNRNHLNIAELLLQGAQVITTNYDMGIQRAYEAVKKGTDRFELIEDDNGICIYSARSENTGRIYHIHGTAEKPEGVGITLDTVKRGFSLDFERMLDYWMNDGRVFVFIGYSCSDSFDVNPYFDDRINKNEPSAATAFYIQHNVQNTIPQNAKRIMKSFAASFEYILDTTSVLTHLGGQGDPDYDKPYDWADCFKKHANNMKDNVLKDMVIVRLGYMLGINAEVLRPGIMRRLEKNIYPINRLQYRFALQYMYKQQNKITKYKKIIDSTCAGEFADNERQKRYENLQYWGLTGRDDLVSENLNSINELMDDVNLCIKENKKVDWHVSTPANLHYHIILNKLNKDLFSISCMASSERRKISWGDNKDAFKTYNDEASACLKLLDEIVNLRFNQVEAINQYALALRIRSSIKAVMNFDEPEVNKDIDSAIYYYAEVTCIDGICGSLIVKAVNKIYLFIQNGESKYLRDAYAVIKKARKIAFISGSVKHKQNSTKVLRLIQIILIKRLFGGYK